MFVRIHRCFLRRIAPFFLGEICLDHLLGRFHRSKIIVHKLQFQHLLRSQAAIILIMKLNFADTLIISNLITFLLNLAFIFGVGNPTQAWIGLHPLQGLLRILTQAIQHFAAEFVHFCQTAAILLSDRVVFIILGNLRILVNEWVHGKVVIILLMQHEAQWLTLSFGDGRPHPTVFLSFNEITLHNLWMYLCEKRRVIIWWFIISFTEW